MNETLVALIAAADKATPGPYLVSREECEYDVPHPHWFLQAVCGKQWDNIAVFGASSWEDTQTYTEGQKHANAVFVAAAMDAIPALRASLARDAALEAFVKEVEHEADILIADKYGNSSNPERHAALIWCQDRLSQIREGRK